VPCDKHVGGWARETTGQLKKENFCLSSIIDELEVIAEVCCCLHMQLIKKSNEQIARLLREEELKWY
jgi:hypothetical protein